MLNPKAPYYQIHCDHVANIIATAKNPVQAEQSIKLYLKVIGNKECESSNEKANSGLLMSRNATTTPVETTPTTPSSDSNDSTSTRTSQDS